MNVRLYEIEDGALIDLERICAVTKVFELRDDNEKTVGWGYKVLFGDMLESPLQFEKKDKAELSRFRLIERWNAYIDYRYEAHDILKEKKK